MQSNMESQMSVNAGNLEKKESINLTLQRSGIQMGEILSDVSEEDDRKVLRKIDRL